MEAVGDSPNTHEARGHGAALSVNVVLRLGNEGKQAISAVIADLAYGAAPVHTTIKAGEHKTLVFALGGSHGWYDLSLTAPAHPGFGRRYAGHVDTGLESSTDPQMALRRS